MRNPSISFVIPVYNEQESLPVLHTQISGMVARTLKNRQIEIIFVNDGSADDSLAVLRSMQQQDKRIRIISLRKNAGKALALGTGLRRASGDIIVTLDADLQDGPENVPKLLKKLDDQYDLVVGWKERRHDPITKVIPSRVFNFIVRLSSGISLHDFNSGLKVMRSQVAQELELYGENHRFIPVLAVQRGFTVAEVSVIHHPRKFGKSKYGASRIIKGYLDFMTVQFLGTYGQRPLHIFGYLGLTAIALGISIGIYLSILHFLGQAIGDRPLLLLAILLIVLGFQVLTTGLLAEMIVNKSKGKDSLPIDYES